MWQCDLDKVHVPQSQPVEQLAVALDILVIYPHDALGFMLCGVSAEGSVIASYIQYRLASEVLISQLHLLDTGLYVSPAANA